MKLSFAVLVVIVLYTYNSGPCTAYPSNNEMQGDGSGDEDERANNIREILEGENVNESDSDSEYDIIHKVVIDNSNDEDDEVGEDDEEVEGEEDDDDDDEDTDDSLPYEKYKLWTEGRGWPKHPLYVIILGG